MSADPLDPDRERRVVWVLAGIQFMYILDFVLMMPLGPQLMRLFSISPREFGFLVSVYMFSAATSGVIASVVADRFDRRSVLLVLQGGFVCALAATALAPSYHWLVVAHACAGAFGGVLAMQVQAYVGDLIPDGRRGKAIGVIMSAFAVASVAGVPAGLMLADVSSWRAPFAVLACATLALNVFGARVLPRLGGHVAERRAERALAIYGRVLSEPNHLRAFILIACATFASFLIVPYIAPYMVRNVGVAERDVALMYFFGGFTTFFSARWIGRQIDLRGKQRMFRVLGIASIVPMIAITHLPPSPLWVAILVGVLFMVLVSGRYVPVMSIVNAAGAPRMRGSYLSLSGAVQQTAAGSASLVSGGILGSTATGELIRFNWVGLLAAAAMVVAIGWAGRVRSVS